MAGLFNIPNRNVSDSDILKKSKSKKSAPATKKSGGSISTRIANIVALVEEHLGKYAEETIVIQDEDTLIEYIDKIIEHGIVAIDTETTGLNPMTDELVGIGLCTIDEKTTYIPLNHKSYVTGIKSKNQLDCDFVAEQMQRLIDAKVFVVMFNAPFDIRMIMHGLGIRFHCDWDCQLASRCLNENEPQKALKKLHQKYVLRGKEDAFKFDDLFKGITFDLIPIKTGALYAAHDPKITLEYYLYQRQHLRLDHERQDMRDVAWVFFNIEMPVVDAVIDLEETGVAFDMEYNRQLQEKYHELLHEREEKFHELCEMYEDEIRNYSGKDRLDDPISITSPKQLAVLLYDIMGLPLFYDKKAKKETRSTSEEALQKLKNPVADAILEYREFSTIVSTFIDKLPGCVNKKDGRIHCKFNQYGADTGRFSSQDPNLQNIPSHNKDIRKMFKATDGYVMMSADFSQQEVKGMAQMCGDEGMIEAFRQGKDFYAEIASVAFGYPYEECLEFRPDGTTNLAGKDRRAQAKSILLGINYGRGAASIAEQIGCSKKEAERIKEDVFNGFPAIAEFERQSFEMAETLGYVTTLWGRKRRFPSMLLPDYEFTYASASQLPNVVDDPLDFDMADDDEEREVPQAVIDKYLKRLSKAWGGQKKKIFEQANAEGIWIVDNTKDKDYTKIVNARIQGSAADQSKLCMIAINKDERLKELGFRMLIPVHDEIIAECPEENAVECAERFKYLMEHSSGEKYTVPVTVDVEITHRWYGKKYRIVDGELVEEEE